MEERYPYISFVIDAAQVIGGAVGLIVLVAGTVSSCHRGGFAGFFEFLVALAAAGVAYVGVMVTIESFRILIDIESGVRRCAATQRESSPPSGPTS